jgi:hypothetical protein
MSLEVSQNFTFFIAEFERKFYKPHIPSIKCINPKAIILFYPIADSADSADSNPNCTNCTNCKPQNKKIFGYTFGIHFGDKTSIYSSFSFLLRLAMNFSNESLSRYDINSSI